MHGEAFGGVVKLLDLNYLLFGKVKISYFV
jgi:hypothetical protein